MRDLITCQCSRGTPACQRTATQEDFLCDVCRGGCSQIGFGSPGASFDDIQMTSHWEAPTVTFEGDTESPWTLDASGSSPPPWTLATPVAPRHKRHRRAQPQQRGHPMTPNRLSGHTLSNEGAPFTWIGSSGRHVRTAGRHGVALCSCGETSPPLGSNNARKRWHREHKDELRGGAAALVEQIAVAIERLCPDPDTEHLGDHCPYREAADTARKVGAASTTTKETGDRG
ncbi:hypothetical protein GCM10017559_08210 [Streptosporangium longisporum]|uniref:Uncharacterized protein n=1 Tax=Streptosporangium longisporum TaxID=46187 RepID=A0ABN3XRN2_9ACTN